MAEYSDEYRNLTPLMIVSDRFKNNTLSQSSRSNYVIKTFRQICADNGFNIQANITTDYFFKVAKTFERIGYSALEKAEDNLNIYFDTDGSVYELLMTKLEDKTLTLSQYYWGLVWLDLQDLTAALS